MFQTKNNIALKVDTFTPSGVIDKLSTGGVLYINKMVRTKIICVYQIKSKINGKKYIGGTVNFKRRKSEHQSMLRYKQHTKLIQVHSDKYGMADLEFIILELCNKEKLLEREQYYMDKLKPEFNRSPIAGSTLGVKYSDEAKYKISKAHIGLKATKKAKYNMSKAQKGKNNGMYGKHHTNETKEKIGKVHKGKKVVNSKATRRKISIANKGKVLTEDHKRKISTAIKGIWYKKQSELQEYPLPSLK